MRCRRRTFIKRAGVAAVTMFHGGVSGGNAPTVNNYAELRALTSAAKVVTLTGAGKGGDFISRPDDLLTPDDGGRYIRRADGTLYERQVVDGLFRSQWYATLASAVAAAAGASLLVEGSHPLTAQVEPADGTRVFLAPSADVHMTVANISAFRFKGKTDCLVYGQGGGKIRGTVAEGAVSSYVAGVHIDGGSQRCHVLGDIEFSGLQWAGVLIDNAHWCQVDGPRMHDWLGNIDNSAGVIIYRDSTNNTARNIRCERTGWIGGYIQDPGGVGSWSPTDNTLDGFTVRETKAYGLMVYTGRAGNAHNKIVNFDVAGVSGTAGLGQYGAGVYCVGHGLGGLVVANGRVHDCAQKQTLTTNGHGGVVITGNIPGYVKPQVYGVQVSGMTQGNGIQAVSCYGGVVIGPNTVHMPASNNGTGPGRGLLVGSALMVFECNDVVILPGSYENAGTGAAVTVLATTTNLTGLVINAGTAKAVGNALRVATTGGFNIRAELRGGSYKSIGATANAVSLEGLSGLVQGLHMDGVVNPTLAIAGCPDLHLSENNIKSTALCGVSIGGVCTGSTWARSNTWQGRFENSGTGMRVEVASNGMPTAGLYRPGDRAENTVAVA